MISAGQRKRVRPIDVALLRETCLTVIGTLSLFGCAVGGQQEAQRGRAPETASVWAPDVQREWERYGGKYFQSVPASQPHATLLLKDSANRAEVGAFDIWVLIDGELVKDWTKSSPLRLSPGQHCIRVEMVSIPQRYQGTLGEYWPSLPKGFEDGMRLVGDSKAGFTVKYERIRIVVNVEGLIDEEKIKFSRGQPADKEAVYDYCLKYVRERRSQ